MEAPGTSNQKFPIQAKKAKEKINRLKKKNRIISQQIASFLYLYFAEIPNDYYKENHNWIK